MRIGKIIFSGLVAVMLAAGFAYPNDKGKGDEHRKKNPPGQEQKGQGNQHRKKDPPGLQKKQLAPPVQAGREQVQQRKLEKKLIPPSERGQRRGHLNNGRGRDMLNNLRRALERTRWWYNPNDNRGQGNRGKVKMRAPYGFDKDSGREKSERGRVVPEQDDEPLLNLADIITINFGNTALFSSEAEFQSFFSLWWQELLTYYATNYPQYYDMILSNHDFYYNLLRDYYLYARVKTKGTETFCYELVMLNYSGTIQVNNTINYTLSLSDYSGTVQIVSTIINVDTGEVVVQETVEVNLTPENNTFTYTYDPPDDLTGYYQLSVTVTDTTTGQSYTQANNTALCLYRDPYGVVYDVRTGRSIVGAKVTVYYDNGALVSLDKAANPHTRNPMLTDATGRYRCYLQMGRKYYMVVKAEGYKLHKTRMFGERWHIVREDIALEPINK